MMLSGGRHLILDKFHYQFNDAQGAGAVCKEGLEAKRGVGGYLRIQVCLNVKYNHF